MSSTTPGSDPERHDDTTADDAANSEPTAAPESESAPGEPEVSEAYDASPAADAADAQPASPTDDETPDAATARLDAAVERANADAAASETNGIDEAAAAPEPVPAETAGRETYVPSATVAAGTTAAAATPADEPAPLYVEPQPPQQTIYVQAPTPPKMRGNRAFGVLVALIGTALFALLYAGVAYLLLLGQGDAGEANAVFTEFLVKYVFWVPVAVFFIGFALLAAIVNRGPYWTYAVFGLLVAALVYFSYIGGALLTVEAWTRTAEQAGEFIAQRWLDPFAITAAILAIEIPIWLGGWIAARGRAVTERNRLALEEYDRELAAGPQVQR